MPSAELLWTYTLAISLLTLTPGVDTLLVVRNTARGGLRDGLTSSLGICCGLFIHASLSAVGISLILVQTAWAFSALKWAGAVYLIWLGLSSLRQAMRTGEPMARTVVRHVTGFSVRRSLREGLLSNLLNPKTALFYMAFLPQFIDPAGSAFAQSLGLAAIHFVIAMVWQSAMAVFVARTRRWEVRSGWKRLLTGLSGTMFIGLGARLAITQP